jgi:hypothetical protein
LQGAKTLSYTAAWKTKNFLKNLLLQLVVVPLLTLLFIPQHMPRLLQVLKLLLHLLGYRILLLVEATAVD